MSSHTVVVLALAYGGLLAWGVAGALAFIVARPVTPLDVPTWLLLANAVLMIWRLGLRALIVAQLYGWREGARSIPRALIANLVALLAARRALMRYIGMLRGHATVWDKTRHVYPETLPAE